MKDLLVCAAHHDAPGRLQYLREVIRMFREEYPKDAVDVIVDTDANPADGLSAELDLPIGSFVEHHAKLAHPFNLTWKHRKHMKERVNDYRFFMYVEDDMRIPYTSFLWFVGSFRSLWDNGAIPAFVRVEKHEGQDYVVDVTYRQSCAPIEYSGLSYCELTQPYHACWIMPGVELKETMTKDFVRVSDSRETAASYPMWELHKRPLVSVFNDGDGCRISPSCLVYHLPNGYSKEPSVPFGKIKLEELFL